jgi:hypothetical protein
MRCNALLVTRFFLCRTMRSSALILNGLPKSPHIGDSGESGAHLSCSSKYRVAAKRGSPAARQAKHHVACSSPYLTPGPALATQKYATHRQDPPERQQPSPAQTIRSSTDAGAPAPKNPAVYPLYAAGPERVPAKQAGPRTGRQERPGCPGDTGGGSTRGWFNTGMVRRQGWPVCSIG